MAGVALSEPLDTNQDVAHEERAGETSFGVSSVLVVVAWIVPALVSLVALPVLAEGLGAATYGLLVLITAMTGYIGLLDLGLGQAVVRYVSYYRVRNEGRAMRAVVRVAVSWFFAVGVAGGVLFFFLAPWLVDTALDVPQAQQTDAVLAVRIAAVSLGASMVMTVLSQVPQGFLRYDIVAAMTLTVGVLSGGGPAVVVMAGRGLVGVVVFTLVLNVTAAFVYFLISRRLFKPIDPHAGPSWREIRRRVLSFIGLTALTRAHSAATVQTTRVVVGVVTGTAAAAYFQVPSQLMTRVGGVLSRVGQISFPTFTALLAKDDMAGVRSLYMRISRLFYLVNAALGASTAALADPLLRYWMNPEYAEAGRAALVVFAVSQVVNASTMSASYVNLSTEHPGINLGFSALNSGVALATLYPLVVAWGVPGAALSGVLGCLTVPFFFAYSHRRVLGVSSWRVLVSCYASTTAVAVAAGILGWLLLAPRMSSLWATLSTAMVLTTAIMVVGGIAGAVKREDVLSGRRTLTALLRLPHRH